MSCLPVGSDVGKSHEIPAPVNTMRFLYFLNIPEYSPQDFLHGPLFTSGCEEMLAPASAQQPTGPKWKSYWTRLKMSLLMQRTSRLPSAMGRPKSARFPCPNQRSPLLDTLRRPTKVLSACPDAECALRCMERSGYGLPRPAPPHIP